MRTFKIILSIFIVFSFVFTFISCEKEKIVETKPKPEMAADKETKKENVQTIGGVEEWNGLDDCWEIPC